MRIMKGALRFSGSAFWGRTMRLRQIASSSGLTAIVCIAILLLLSGCALFRVTAADLDRGDGNTLLAFRSDDQIRRFLNERREQIRSLQRSNQATSILVTGSMIVAEEDYSSADLGEYIESGAVTTGQAITNTQESAVDEGGIVKMFSRDIMVVLRRGRIFTISLGGGNIRPLDSIDAYPPGVNAQDDWYDEMLVAENRVIVIGYSYERGGTEINRFRIDGAGGLEFEDSHHFTSADYYSSSNYASRLIGDELVFYTEVYLPYRDEDPIAYFPTLSRWNPVVEERTIQRVIAPENIYIPAGILDDPEIAVDALHTVTRCDLSAPSLSCRMTGVLGPDSRSFYVSRSAVYVWATEYRRAYEADERDRSSFVLRLPFDDGVPRGVVARGAPMDQFSFREDYRRGALNVLIGSGNNGDAFWSGERSEGQFALVTIPIDEFGNGGEEIDASNYVFLPSPQEAQYLSQNRFVGDYVL